MDTSGPLLALDCSTRWCVLALRDADRVGRFTADLGREHSQRLLSAIAALRDETGLGRKPLGGLGVVVGPGSFTGVRIAVATAQALAFAYGCPVARLDALQLLAETAIAGAEDPAALLGTAGVVCCARRSRGELYYLGAYGFRRGSSQRLGDLALIGSEAELELWWQDCMRSASVASPVAAHEVCWFGDTPPWAAVAGRAVDPSPDAMLSLTERAFAASAVVAAADALPLYLEADSPWQRSVS